ncbi:hypothetical protein IMG5_064450 [Ichthyophthirius multifiliis]|uniref:Uncharacterized protein n=1 Tax=Ichthyophthirius multifiliis TaxID=5932 RepID=G0QP60_ICHMU|nr:hypothetical protein IMG5_064450 [Ichthyophthirius multifiliis]EGR32990.1 hypothetical protein IMG5_064450 [Ichthyophthirius multifiliis]|eukprot:XP_004036976.1 hypothetical protein IMG5_064450 [Ichthyophthirius multifiliis]
MTTLNFFPQCSINDVFYGGIGVFTIPMSVLDLSDLQNSTIGDEFRPSDESEKWLLLSRELSQKVELIHRMKKQFNDKNISLKQNGEEITDLRKSIKLLKNENNLLQKRINSEKRIEQQTKVTQEIRNMSEKQLVDNLIKVSTKYREEALRNEKFDEKIKEIYNQIIQAKHNQKECETLQNTLRSRVFGNGNSEIDRGKNEVLKLQNINKKIIDIVNQKQNNELNENYFDAQGELFQLERLRLYKKNIIQMRLKIQIKQDALSNLQIF